MYTAQALRSYNTSYMYTVSQQTLKATEKGWETASDWHVMYDNALSSDVVAAQLHCITVE